MIERTTHHKGISRRKGFVYRCDSVLFVEMGGDVLLSPPIAGMILGRLVGRNSPGGGVNVSTLWYWPGSDASVCDASLPLST